MGRLRQVGGGRPYREKEVHSEGNQLTWTTFGGHIWPSEDSPKSERGTKIRIGEATIAQSGQLMGGCSKSCRPDSSWLLQRL